MKTKEMYNDLKNLKRNLRKEMLFVFLGLIFFALPLQVKAANVSERENNNTFQTANAINFGDTINGSITQTDDVDIYRVNVSSAGKLVLDVTAYMKYYSTRIYGTDGNDIWYTEWNEWNSNVGYQKDAHTVYLEKGIYYIEMNGYQYSKSNKATGTYQLKVSYTSSNVTNREPDNSFSEANALSLGSKAVGQISQNDAYDFYRIQTNSSGKVIFKMTSYMKYYCIKLFDSDGNEIWSTNWNEWNGNVGYRSDTYEWDLEKGTYYAEINGYQFSDYNKSTGKYFFDTSFRSSNANNREPNNTFSTAQQLSWNSIVNGQIALDDDYDLYKFDCSSGKKVTLSITSYMQNYCINIYDASGKTVWSTSYKEWNENVKYRKDIHDITLSKGSYYLEINGYRWGKYSKSTGNYSFKISDGKTTSLSLSKSNLTLAYKKTAKLTARISPASSGSMKWSSSNRNVVTVSSKGVLTAKYPGTATITCSTTDGSQKKASCKVTVTPAKAQIAKVSAGKKRAAVTWKKLEGVSGYEVYMSLSSKTGFQTIRTINRGTTTSYKKTGLKKGKRYYFKVRGYKMIAGKKVYGSYSSTVSTRVR